jgi:hypothetical protein
MMKTRFFLAAVAVLAMAAGTAAADPPIEKPAAGAAAKTASAGTLVYYFHRTSRCATCRTIEAYAQEAVTSGFAEDLQSRRLEWRVVNVDEPSNRHFVDDFQLYTRSVVVVDGKDPKRFRVLDRVWQLVRDKAAFQKYVDQEIRAFRRS